MLSSRMTTSFRFDSKAFRAIRPRTVLAVVEGAADFGLHGAIMSVTSGAFADEHHQVDVFVVGSDAVGGSLRMVFAGLGRADDQAARDRWGPGGRSCASK